MREVILDPDHDIFYSYKEESEAKNQGGREREVRWMGKDAQVKNDNGCQCPHKEAHITVRTMSCPGAQGSLTPAPFPVILC